MNAVTTSIRMPREVRDQYETLAQATGRTRNELMVDALRVVAERQLLEIAMIQEGVEQARALQSKRAPAVPAQQAVPPTTTQEGAQ